MVLATYDQSLDELKNKLDNHASTAKHIRVTIPTSLHRNAADDSLPSPAYDSLPSTAHQNKPSCISFVHPIISKKQIPNGRGGAPVMAHYGARHT